MAAIRSVHQCLFCPQTFGSAAEKDDHVLEHFAQKTCADCNQNLIQIGGNLYTLHNTVTCVKQELKGEQHFESCFVEQPLLPNEKQTECDDTTNLDSLIEDDIQVKAEVLSEWSTEEIQNQSKTTDKPGIIENHPMIGATSNDQSDDDQMIKDDFTFDSIQSEESDFETVTFTNNEQSKVFNSLDESRKKQNCKVTTQPKQVKSDNILEIQSKECKVLLNRVPGDNFCKHCFKLFATVDKLTEHITECSIKNEVATNHLIDSKHKIKNPKQLHKIIRKFSCDICDKSYASTSSLSKHKLVKHCPPGTYACTNCQKIYMSENEFIEHRELCRLKRKYRCKNLIDANATFECYVCKKNLKSLASIFAHMRWKHQPDGVKYKCDPCKMAFFSKSRLEMHLRRHNQPKNDRNVMCSVCGIYLKKTNSLKVHMYIHTGEKPYKCTHEGCNKDFRSKASRAEHMRRHTKEKPYHCLIDDCNQRFSYTTNFRRHKYKIHGIFTKKLPCSICGEIFPEVFLLKKHMKKHEN